MKVIDFPQGTAEWKAARAGKVTASRMCDVIAKIKTGEAAARRDYRAQIVAEILTGRPQDDGYVSADMQWGIDNEPLARCAYELATEQFVDQVGLIVHPVIERSAASPDGIAGDGLLEIKCPKTATHLRYLMDGAVPSDYEPQMMWQMACAEREWVDFVSFDPRLPAEKLRFFKKRLMRNDARIKELEREVIAFLADVDKMLTTIRAFA